MFEDVDVIIPFRAVDPHRSANADFIEAHLQESLPGAMITRSDDPDPLAFNRGRAVNSGVRFTSRSILVIADGDVWLPKTALREAVNRVRRGVGSYVIPFSKIIWFHQGWTEEVLANRKYIGRRPPPAEILLEWGGSSTGITNVVSRNKFEAFGGFDPRFHGWGFEDCAWEIMASTLGGRHVRLHYEGRHLYHHPCTSKDNHDQIAVGQSLHRRYVESLGNREACLILQNEVAQLRALEDL